MLGWAEVCMHFFDFFHVVFVACCCNPCEAFKMFIGEAVSLFPLYSVHGWECWLASVCAHKEGHHFLHKWLQSGKIFFRHQTPEVTNTCSEFNFENVFCLQFYHFTFYSSTLCRAEQSDSWSERWHIYVEGVFNEVENLLVLIHILESGFKFPPQLFQNIHKFSVAEVLQQRWVICSDSSEFGEVNEFSVRYVQGSYFVLKCSDCIQHVVWKLISSLKLQVKSVQVTGDVSKKSQLCDPAWVFQLWLPFSFAVQESANLREEAQKPFKHFSTGQPSHFTVHQ